MLIFLMSDALAGMPDPCCLRRYYPDQVYADSANAVSAFQHSDKPVELWRRVGVFASLMIALLS